MVHSRYSGNVTTTTRWPPRAYIVCNNSHVALVMHQILFTLHTLHTLHTVYYISALQYSSCPCPANHLALLIPIAPPSNTFKHFYCQSIFSFPDNLNHPTSQPSLDRRCPLTSTLVLCPLFLSSLVQSTTYLFYYGTQQNLHRGNQR